ncbi:MULTISPECIES: hypothetical protein [unclassified Burkholderia]|uniref:hypothetical protein n=1 Tax=unclassified Burkholderia TaxID=2613784 RepID=UPI0007521D91|nr:MULTISPECIES: hypothetical protein [unclassified Burkholderia]AOI77676.1 hypothetical protein WS54_15045 [Burkholderia sp. NRF60-BP8]KVA17704.1 hypothetical protein WS54_03730 [Burkholderia sp. NRF60-BP8]KVL17293.1 hypothetical protein WS95_03425 [Burkholderia sp. MSMB1826]KWE61951.1 hypothetical protein WT53_03545 [Burkholderia sp. MSMB2157WGS]
MNAFTRGLLVAAAVVSMGGAAAANAVAAEPASTPAAPTVYPAVERLLADLRTRSTPGQYAAVAGAIHASAALAGQLNELVDAGLLTRIAVDSGEPALGRTSGALRNGSVWILTPAFVDSQAPRRLSHVVHDGDILPDNMVFALGYMAWRAKHDTDLGREAAALRASGDSPDEKKRRWIELNTRIDAGGFIQGWNDTVDAATAQHGGQPVGIAQVVPMLMNLRYRGPLIKAIQATPPLRVTATTFSFDTASIDALALALKGSGVIDIEPFNAAR